MATIIKKKTKSGISYRIQVRVKNKGTGKSETKVTTWRKSPNVSERDSYKAALKYSIEFEDQVKKEYNLNNAAVRNITLGEYSVIWANYIKERQSPSYYCTIKYTIGTINEKIGCYKLKELTPIVIQKFIDGLLKRTKIKKLAKATNLKRILKEKKLSQEKIARICGVARPTIEFAIKGKNITEICAKKIADGLSMDVKDLFNIQVITSPYESATIAKICRILRSILSMAKRQQLIEHNYASSEYVSLVKEERKDIHYLDDIQAKTLLTGLRLEEDIRIKTSLMMLIFTGFRRGELCGLEWQDVNLEEETITIERSSSPIIGMGVVTGKPKTQTSARTIVVPNTVIELLKSYRKWWDDYTKQLGDRYKGSQRLFIQSEGEPLYPSTIGYWLNKITKRLGLPSINVHSLRHTNITMQIMAGIPLKTVSVRAGHSSTKVTSDVYSHFVKSSDREAAVILDNMLK